MKTMRIAFYTDTYLPNIDGVVSQVIASKQELERRRHYVHVFTPGTRKEKLKFQSPTVTYYEGVKFPLYPAYKLAIFPYSSILKCRQTEIEIIHCHALATMSLASIASAKALNLPLIGTFHTMIPLAAHYLTQNKEYQKMLTNASWKAIKTLYKPFDVVTAPSNTIAHLLEEHGVENVKVVSNGISTHSFNSRDANAEREKSRKRLGIQKNELVFLFVGRITEEKNVNVVVKAFDIINAIYPNTKLLIVGDGPAFSPLKQFVVKVKAKKSITLVGQVNHSEMLGYYAACDWQVTASTFETQGLGILEGMACGKPCIGANALAIPETVKNNLTGYLFPAYDVEKCVEKMEAAIALNDSSKYSKMCRNAGTMGEKHSIQRTTIKWEKLYRSVL